MNWLGSKTNELCRALHNEAAPMKVRVEAELGIDARVYFLERDGAAFRSFIADEMSLLEYEITECWKEGAVTMVKLNSKPDVSAWVPDSLAKRVGGTLEYFDVISYDPARLAEPPYELAIRSEAPFLGSKASFSSRTIIEPLGPDRCRHVLEQTIEFHGMFGLGAVAKKLAKNSLQQSFDDMPGIIERWVALRQELMQTPHGRQRLLAGRPKVQGVPWIDELVSTLQQGQRHRHHKERRSAGKQEQQQAAEGGQPAEGPAEPAISAYHHQPQVESTSASALPSMQAPQSAFAAAAAAARQPSRGRQWERMPPGRQQQGNQGTLVQDAAPQEEAEEFYDAEERRRGSLASSAGESVYFSPQASLAVVSNSEDAEASAQGTVATGISTGALLPSPFASASQQLPSPAAGAGVNKSEASRSSSTRESDESEHSSDSDEWSHCTRWRAFYQQLGHRPSMRPHRLPEVLVRKFVSGRRLLPVEVKRLAPTGRQHAASQESVGAGTGAASSSRSRGGRRQKAGLPLVHKLKYCMGMHTTAKE